MKKYKEYMDNVRASDTLHQRLLGLEASGKRPIPWKRYGTIAAALALVVGLGAWGLGKSGGWGALTANFQPDANAEPGIPDVDVPEIADIAIEEPGDVTEPAEKTLGGYEVTSGSGENAITSYYILPYIEYGDTYGAAETVMDWDIPAGAVKRELPRDEIAALMGGEDVLSAHLNWDGWELSGWAAWYEDGSLWGVYLNGVEAEYGTDTFQFAVTRGHLPPTCIVYANSVTQEIRGITVIADKYDWELGDESIMRIPERRVSFMQGDYGYRFEVRTADTGLAEEMVSRLVCRIADQGLPLTDTEFYAVMRSCLCSVCGEEIVPGTNHFHASTGAEGSYTCSNCGQFVPAGEKHSHTFVGEGSIPSFAPDYDPTYEDGVSGDGPDICGYPLYDPNEAANPTYNAPNPKDSSFIDTVGSIAPALYQSEPPTLRVLSSEGLVDGHSGNYAWSYTDLGSGKSASAIACGLHPLDYREAPSLATADGTVTLNFFDLPDRVSVVCWPDSEWGNTSAQHQSADVARREHDYGLVLKEGGWIYEISAQWDDQGTASYVFYLIKN